MSAGEVVGRIASIHRYPVKSMAGESLDAGVVTADGILGDRAYALIDTETGCVVSGKRPRKWPAILEYRAAFASPPREDHGLPEVVVRFPTREAVSSADGPELEGRLTESLGTPVRLARSAPEGARFEYHWPDMEGLEYKGRVYRDEITSHELLPGTFFDGSHLHLLTTASLAHLEGLTPGSAFASARFRPNFVIETPPGRTGLVENDWVGRTLAIGDHVRIEITDPCFRCVMVTLPQDDLGKDPRVLRSAFEHNDGNVGVKATPVEAGRVAVGDAARLV